MFRATEPHLEHTFFVTFPTKRQSFHRAFFCAEICTISAQNPQCLHKSLHQNQTKKARKCDKGHVATKAHNHQITEAFSCQKKGIFLQQKTQKNQQYMQFECMHACNDLPVKEKSFQPPFLYFKWAPCQMVQMSAHVCNVNLEKCRYLHKCR